MANTDQPALRVPYSQQFSPKQTPLRKLLPILRQNTGKRTEGKLKKAIASAFFDSSPDPNKLAGNTLAALRYYGILEGDELTEFGLQLISLQGKEDEAHAALAKRILLELDGFPLVETLREMRKAGLKIELTTIPTELKQRGFEASRNSSDLSGVLGWLRQAGVLSGYEVNEAQYQALIGTSPETVEAMKGLSKDQISFLQAMLALNVTEWTPYNEIADYAENLYTGQIGYNWKAQVTAILKPLQDAGLIEIRKKAKKDKRTREGQGGKAGDVKPTPKFETEIAEPLLGALYRSAGFNEIRAIRGKSLADIVADIKQQLDANKSGKALEWLAIRLCQMLDLDFMGWRETEIEVAGGGEVDAMMHSSRLIYSRWQVQCKVGVMSAEAVMKEVGLQQISLANVILLVSTGRATSGAITYREKIIRKSNLNIIFIDGTDLQKIIKDNAALVEVLNKQAQDALRLKPSIGGLKNEPPSQEGEPGAMPPADTEGNEPPRVARPVRRVAPAYSTELGRMYCGDALEVLPYLIEQGVRAKLIHTSPPFALVRKKEYDNEDSDSYIHWFEQFIPLYRQILEPQGSLIIDIGGAWIKGLPVKSVYQYKLLVKLCQSGFYLAQEFYHYNPSRLPTPAEWVTIRRLRVKDAVNNVWWLTLDPYVDADNRRILLPYSDSMKSLLKNGYKPAMRPSGHDISDKFQKDNGGAIPPNLLTLSNTESKSHYLKRCKEKGIKVHPARFPHALPDFFIRFLTNPGDLILDTFAGSNVTGEVAESLGRQWVSIELEPDYVAGSRFRFEDEALLEQEKRRAAGTDQETLPFFTEVNEEKFVH
jgi:site-specific DNA-methyltransferase (cytosine-N4-specific)